MENLSKIELIDQLYQKMEINPFDGTLGECEGQAIKSNSTLFLEGINFDLTYTPLKHLGYKALLASIGPLYAAGFNPVASEITIALSSRFSNDNIFTICEGIAAAIKEHKIEKVKLDLVPSLTGLTILLSSQGKQKSSLFVQRPKCESGDLICINGSLGASYLGLRILEREKSLYNESGVQPKLEGYEAVLRPFLSPAIDRVLFELLEENNISPSNGLFMREGLAHAVKSICHKERLGAKLFLERIPLASNANFVADELGIDPLTAALNGGEEYKFIFTLPLEQYQQITKEFPQLDIIGHMSDYESGANLITPDGEQIELKAQAWDK